jgi:hypothetical protein
MGVNVFPSSPCSTSHGLQNHLRMRRKMERPTGRRMRRGRGRIG